MSSLHPTQPKSSRAATAEAAAAAILDGRQLANRDKRAKSKAALDRAAADALSRFGPEALFDADVPPTGEPAPYRDREYETEAKSGVVTRVDDGAGARSRRRRAKRAEALPLLHPLPKPRKHRVTTTRPLTLVEQRELRRAKRRAEEERWERENLERQRLQRILDAAADPNVLDQGPDAPDPHWVTQRMWRLDVLRMRNAILTDPSGKMVWVWASKLARGGHAAYIWAVVRGALGVCDDPDGRAERVVREREKKRAAKRAARLKRQGKPAELPPTERAETDDPRRSLLVLRTWRSERARSIVVLGFALLMISKSTSEKHGRWTRIVRGFSVSNFQTLLRSPYETDPDKRPSRWTLSGTSRDGRFPGWSIALERAGAMYSQQLPVRHVEPWEIGGKTGRAYNRYWLVGLTITGSCEINLTLHAWHEAGSDIAASAHELVLRDRAPPAPS